MHKNKSFSINAIKKMKLDLPVNLRKYLTRKQLLLLKCISSKLTIQTMVKITEYSRHNIIVELMQLGRTLATYDMLENNCFPKRISSEDYLDGWNDLKESIRKNSRSVVNEKKYWSR